MSDIKLFKIGNSSVQEIEGTSVAVELPLQKLIERNLETFFGIRFLASEYSTGRTHGGRIDTLGIDENSCPVIIEYKRSVTQNVINQGLFYLDWLLDHKAEFTLLVQKCFGNELANQIEWSSPRLICIAGDFTRYDLNAIQQINHNIELTRYVRYGDDLLLLELINSTQAQYRDVQPGTAKPGNTEPTVTDYLARANEHLQNLYEELKSFCTNLGEDVQVKTLRDYIAFRRLRNFACIEVHPRNEELVIYVKVHPDTIVLEPGFTRDVRNIGTFGTGDLEIRVKSRDDLKRAEPLLVKSYEAS